MLKIKTELKYNFFLISITLSSKCCAWNIFLGKPMTKKPSTTEFWDSVSASSLTIAFTTRSTTRSWVTKSPCSMAWLTTLTKAGWFLWTDKRPHKSSPALMIFQCGNCSRHRWTRLALEVPGPPIIYITGLAVERNWLSSSSKSSMMSSLMVWSAYKLTWKYEIKLLEIFVDISNNHENKKCYDIIIMCICSVLPCNFDMILWM